MPRTALKCTVEIKIHAVSCPGVWLPNKDDVYLSVCMLGQHKRTPLVDSVFPLTFHTEMRFDKVFWTAVDPADVMDKLEREHVFFELIQLDLPSAGTILGTYECNARDFLYPYPHLAPKAVADRDVLMEKTDDFPLGLSPRIEFTTRTSIRETPTPYTDSYETSITGLDDVTIRVPRSRSRARSPSPVLCERFDDLKLQDLDYHDDDVKPPFVLQPSLIGRKPGSGPSSTFKSEQRFKRSQSPRRPRSVSPSRRSKITRVYCPHCLYPHTDASCTVCQLYKRYTGKTYWGHRYTYHPAGHRHMTTKVIKSPRTFVTSDLDYDYLVEDTLPRDPLMTKPIRRSPSPPFLPRTPLRDSFHDRHIANLIDERVQRAIDRNRMARYSSLYGSRDLNYSTTSVGLDSLDRLALDLDTAQYRRRLRELDDYWAEKAADFKYRHLRQKFDKSLEDSYRSQYRRARSTWID
ncbi:spermatogenesis-associated protein 6-like isoform X2 [Lineus longissimus]|uniref:spermatogenesis-associated protein 6-like isoform X2 n=1 Tax=Lineus longissimus TaxID=88925 RepID=UPI00315CED28